MNAEAKRKGQEMQVVVFTLAGESYGVDITTVREIITMQRITPLPEAPDFVLGVISLRGTVIPVVDLKSRLRLPAQGETAQSRIMVVEAGDRTVGCVVDGVKEVLTIHSDVIEPAAGAAGFDVPYLQGIAKLDEHLVILIDLEQVLEGIAVDIPHGTEAV